MAKIIVGQKAPSFNLPNAAGKNISLSDYSNKWVVIYFYPKDDTPGCTIQALDFTKLAKEFSKAGAVILGISKDNCSSHQKFINKHKLGVELLSDEDHKVQELFGVWRMKKFMGKEYLGTVRSTFLINPSGKFSYIWDNVSAKGHAQEVLKKLAELISE